MKRYQHTYSLTVADIDPQNRMTAGAVLCYFQDTIGRFLAQARVSALDLVKEGKTWMITEFHCFLADKLPAWPGSICVEVFLSELSSLRAYVDYSVREEGGTVVAQGSSCWLMMELASRRMIPCTDITRFASQYDPQNHVPHRRFAFPPFTCSDGILMAEHTVSSLETDFNGHLNNRDSVRLALSLARPEWIANRTIRELHVKFLRECRTGEKMSCRCRNRGQGDIDALLVKHDGTPVCQIATIWHGKQDGAVVEDRNDGSVE